MLSVIELLERKFKFIALVILVSHVFFSDILER